MGNQIWDQGSGKKFSRGDFFLIHLGEVWIFSITNFNPGGGFQTHLNFWGTYLEGVLGIKTPTSLEKFFNLLGFVEEKNPKNPLKFLHPYKKIWKSSLKKFLEASSDLFVAMPYNGIVRI